MHRLAAIVSIVLLFASFAAKGQYFEYSWYYHGYETHMRTYDVRWICTGDTLQTDTTDEGTVRHLVNGYWMSCYEVTRDLWNYYMGDEATVSDPLLPATGHSLTEIDTFCMRISQTTNMAWQLPTVKEWLFAYHGGLESEGYLFSGSNHPEFVAWYLGNSKGQLQPIGGRLPNEVGLYDMLGNAAELVIHGDSTCYIGGCCLDKYPGNNASHLFTSPPPEACGFRIVCHQARYIEN